MSDSTYHFIVTEIAIGYTFLWAACLHEWYDERKQSALQARDAYNTAREALHGQAEPALERELEQLASTIAGWSDVDCADPLRVAMYRRLALQTSERSGYVLTAA